MSDGEAFSTGVKQTVGVERISHQHGLLEKELAEAETSGSHYWIATVAYRIERFDGEDMMLDADSLRAGPNIGCYICEQPYTPFVATRPCPGDPDKDQVWD